MPRRARKDLNASFFHVITQGINKEFIFEKERYKKQYFKLLKEYEGKANIKIISYCIMSNHVHMLIYTENNRELSLFMKMVNENYAKYYNFIENRVGYVFRDRFLSEPIYNEKYLKNCIAYIHNNPVKAKMIMKCEDYQYSSYKDFLENKNFVNDEIIDLVFHSKKIDIKEYEMMHQKNKYFFIENCDNSEENLQEIINEYTKKYKMNYENIKKDEKLLKELIIEAKDRMKISNLKLAELLKINRHKVEKAYL